MEYTFKKSTCERYDIRFRGDWAIITIDENGGLFNCHSSYGNFSYSWPHHGRESFKHFIIELARDKSYLLGKVSDEIFVFDKTIRNWKKELIAERKRRFCEKETAREAFDDLKDIDQCGEEHLWYIAFESEAIRTIFGRPYEYLEVVRDYPHSAHVFAGEIMQIFADILKAELRGA